MEPKLGLEPRTCCLRNSCSTAELLRRIRREASRTSPETSTTCGAVLPQGFRVSMWDPLTPGLVWHLPLSQPSVQRHDSGDEGPGPTTPRRRTVSMNVRSLDVNRYLREFPPATGWPESPESRWRTTASQVRSSLPPSNGDWDDPGPAQSTHGFPVQVDQLGGRTAPIHQFYRYSSPATTDCYSVAAPARAHRDAQLAACRCDHRTRRVSMMADADSSPAIPRGLTRDGVPTRWLCLY